jgi:hypothetical protein
MCHMDRETGPEPASNGPAAPTEELPSFQPRVSGSSHAIMTQVKADPRLPGWIRRGVISALVLLLAWIWLGWRVGLSLAALVAIIDTIYNSRTMAPIPADVMVNSAQRRTRRRLFAARLSGHLAVHSRSIPGTDSVIDHLVVGPGGVYALDSERWDRRLPIRTVASGSAAGAVLYHGPFSQKDRLAHARWEAAQATRLLSAELGRKVEVRPAMVIYGPTVPWAVANLRGVDVLSGRSVVRYFRSRKRSADGRTLSWEEAGEVFAAAQRALP